MNKLAVLAIDDDALFRKAIASYVENLSCISYFQTASSGEIALERLAQRAYDVVLLDMALPDIDGMELQRLIHRKWPAVKVVIVSASGGAGSELTMKALQLGAIDYLLKSDAAIRLYGGNKLSVRLAILLQELADSLATNTRLVLRRPNKSLLAKLRLPSVPKNNFAVPQLVVIVASTGGPRALEEVLRCMPSDIATPFVIVQHMPVGFTHAMANSLTSRTKQQVVEVADEDVRVVANGYLACGGYDLLAVVENGGLFLRRIQPLADSIISPSADAFLQSLLDINTINNILVVILTGMGRDGERGVALLKDRSRCYCIAQSEASSVIYGMPRAVVESGLADEVLHLDDIGMRIAEIARNGVANER